MNNRNSHLWSHENIHGTIEVHFQHKCHVNLWCVMIVGYLTGPFVFHLHFAPNKLPALLGDVQLTVTERIIFQHVEVPEHFAQQLRQHLNLKFPLCWIGGTGLMNRPRRFSFFISLDFCLCLWFKIEVQDKSQFL